MNIETPYSPASAGCFCCCFRAWHGTILLRRRIRAVTRSLSRSERRFQALLEASPDAILSVDAGGNLRFANRSAAENLLECEGRSLPALECGGDSLRGLLHDARQKGCTRATFSPGNDKTFEVIAFSAPDGTVTSFSHAASPGMLRNAGSWNRS